MMAVARPTEQQLPTPLSDQAAWFDPKTGRPTPEFVRYQQQQREAIRQILLFLAQELP